jgi:hypothetical protein
MEKGEVVIDPEVLKSLGSQPKDYVPIERASNPMGQTQVSIEKTLSPWASEKCYEVSPKLSLPGTK